jgi:hypothetical protein
MYPFRHISTQFLKQPVCKHCPMEIILDFLVGERISLTEEQLEK